MTTDNRLLDSIVAAGKEKAEAILQEADNRAAEIADTAKQEAAANASQIKSSTEEKAKGMRKAAESGAALIARNAVLRTKREEISKTLSGIADYIAALNDEQYFALLYRMASGVEEKSGVLFLNERDLARLPADFSAKMKEAGIDAKLSEKAASIDGGFLLQCGEIEINCSVHAVLEDRKNELEDYINQLLFTEEG